MQTVSWLQMQTSLLLGKMDKEADGCESREARAFQRVGKPLSCLKCSFVELSGEMG